MAGPALHSHFWFRLKDGTVSISMKPKTNRSSVGAPPGRSGDRGAWIIGPSVAGTPTPEAPKGAQRLVLLGAPGVGKGTQADLLQQWSRACHLSTGDIFRGTKNLPASERSANMESALAHMARGELVPDETVLALVCERVDCLRCAGGFLLDGFPRTVAQAEGLEELLTKEKLPLTAVIEYDLPIDQIVERLAGRRVCASCNCVSHVTGKMPEICPQCGGKLYQREDDRPQAIRVRMKAYRHSTTPLIEFYRQRGLLLTVPADGAPAEILQRTVWALGARPRSSQ
jgi:adenylate kinase